MAAQEAEALDEMVLAVLEVSSDPLTVEGVYHHIVSRYGELHATPRLRASLLRLERQNLTARLGTYQARPGNAYRTHWTTEARARLIAIERAEAQGRKVALESRQEAVRARLIAHGYEFPAPTVQMLERLAHDLDTLKAMRGENA